MLSGGCIGVTASARRTSSLRYQARWPFPERHRAPTTQSELMLSAQMRCCSQWRRLTRQIAEMLAIAKTEQLWRAEYRIAAAGLPSCLASTGDAALEPLPSLALESLAAYRMGQGPSSTPLPSTVPSLPQLHLFTHLLLSLPSPCNIFIELFRRTSAFVAATNGVRSICTLPSSSFPKRLTCYIWPLSRGRQGGCSNQTSVTTSPSQPKSHAVARAPIT
jgi:hypothetical protein